MIIKIQSQNPKLLDLLFKNPNTDQGLYAKPLKNGVVIGNAINENQYDIVFQDTKYSYLPEDSNAIDFQSYVSPWAVINICTELFAHILKDKTDYANAPITWLHTTQGAIDTMPCTISISAFYIHSTWYRNGEFLLSKYFDGVKVEHIIGKNFALQITGKSVFEAMNLLNLVCVFTHITNEYGKFIFIDDGFAQKYVRILTNIDNVPYFIFYLYIKRAVKNDKQFAMVKLIFESYLLTQGLVADLVYNGTHQERVKYISKKIDMQYAIIDIGCGEFIYYKRMMNLGFKNAYFAIDEDANFEKLGEVISARYNAENLTFYTNINDCITTEKVDIFITEVIEHNTIVDAKALVQKALQYNFNQIIITTPNVSFNQFYAINAGSRHDDHQFEFTEIEFQTFIKECISENEHINIAYEYIGDSLNNIQPTQVSIITKK
jgi:small RNA 2'-O-methyltransferase